MAGHGVTVSGPNMREALNDLYYLERAAMLQILAMSTGKEFIDISADVIEKTAAQHLNESKIVAERHFTTRRRILEKQEPDFLS